MNKIIKIFYDIPFWIYLTIFIFLSPILLAIVLLNNITDENYIRKDININQDYIDSYKCQFGLRDNITYEVYYYDENKDTNMIKNLSNMMVDDSNIEEIKELFKTISEAIDRTDCKTKYHISNIRNISNGDYFYIKRTNKYYEDIKNGCKEKTNYCIDEHKYTVYFYDIDLHILYYVESFNF